jgi:uncharacterized membrane protein
VKKDRVETISDGVMAVAITLLVIDLDIDAKSSTPLATQLREQWPSFAAYVLSFFVIGTLWLNHHNLFRLATRIDRRIMLYNLLMLLLVAAIPFATKTYADYVLAGGANARMAVLLYGGILEATSLLFTLMVVHLVRARLTNPPLSSSDARRLVLRNTAGTFIGPVLIVAGLIKPILLLVFGICAVLYYIGPGLTALELRFSNPTHGSGPRMEQKRVEGFSDAVLVVAITIMVLYLNVDSHSPESLATQLRQQWPSFAAFALSFFVISTVWLQQQSLFRIATSIDQRMVVLNLVLLHQPDQSDPGTAPRPGPSGLLRGTGFARGQRPQGRSRSPGKNGLTRVSLAPDGRWSAEPRPNGRGTFPATAPAAMTCPPSSSPARR